MKWSEVAQSCLTLCDPMGCSPPGSSVHGIFQAIVLECIAISFSRGYSQPRDWTRVSCIVDRRFTVWATSKVLKQSQMITKISRTKLGMVMEFQLSYFKFTWVRSLGWEYPLEKEMAVHSRTIAWKIPWTEEPGRLQSMGSQRQKEFPGGPVVKTPCSQSKGPGFDPWFGI